MSTVETRTVHPHQHGRTKSTFSFRSNSSGKSQKNKIDLRETAPEKARRHLSGITKANPNAAINEAQPMAAAYEDNTISSLRSMQHKDEAGAVINDPDLSNPTRYRWERPLDTIKSFEASIDTAYKRKSMMASDPGPNNRYSMASRPGSYYAGSEHHSPFGRRYSQQQIRSSFKDYAEQGLGGPPPPPMPGAGGRRPRQHPRFQSEPFIPSNRYPNGGIPHQSSTAHQRIPEPIENRSNGSPSEPWGSSTEPSSENSSIERNKMDLSDHYGNNAIHQEKFRRSTDMANYSNYINFNRTRPKLNGDYNSALQQQNGAQILQHGSQIPHPGQTDNPEGSAVGGSRGIRAGGAIGGSRVGSGPKKIIKLSSNQSSQAVSSVDTATNDKRKSWIKRRFSKT